MQKSNIQALTVVYFIINYYITFCIIRPAYNVEWHIKHHRFRRTFFLMKNVFIWNCRNI